MVVDAVRTYLDAANGLTELSRKQAVAAAKTLLRADGAAASAPVASGGEAPPRVGQSIQTLAGELIETSQANRAAVADLVRAEVRQALEQMDMVPRAEYERMVRRVAELERRMAARQVVERVLAPRGGASSALPMSEEDGQEDRARAEAGPRARAQAPSRARAAEAVSAGSGEAVEEAGAALGVEESAPETGDAVPEDSAQGEDAVESGDGESAEESEAAAGDSDADAVGEAGQDGTESGTVAKRTANRGKAKPAAKTTRSRSTAKRTTKSKGAKK
ncbi:hypothetical protein [Nocardiopsis ganjiahuensis]|uniref:hypothetical protein n=1 Tax=Nocardiopsis ganjiahuensis TaxID=239984 RepID=UPI0003485A03|nr:hypothetical protein [Nocardiopsis ganjiahuensis]